MVERATQSVQARLRALKLAVENNRKVELPGEHAMIPWIVEYAAILLNRYEVGQDGVREAEGQASGASRHWVRRVGALECRSCWRSSG